MNTARARSTGASASVGRPAAPVVIRSGSTVARRGRPGWSTGGGTRSIRGSSATTTVGGGSPSIGRGVPPTGRTWPTAMTISAAARKPARARRRRRRRVRAHDHAASASAVPGRAGACTSGRRETPCGGSTITSPARARGAGVADPQSVSPRSSAARTSGTPLAGCPAYRPHRPAAAARASRTSTSASGSSPVTSTATRRSSAAWAATKATKSTGAPADRFGRTPRTAASWGWDLHRRSVPGLLASHLPRPPERIPTGG